MPELSGKTMDDRRWQPRGVEAVLGVVGQEPGGLGGCPDSFPSGGLPVVLAGRADTLDFDLQILQRLHQDAVHRAYGGPRQRAAALAASGQQALVQVVDGAFVQRLHLPRAQVRDDVAADDVAVVARRGLLHVQFPPAEPRLQLRAEVAVGGQVGAAYARRGSVSAATAASWDRTRRGSSAGAVRQRSGQVDDELPARLPAGQLIALDSHRSIPSGNEVRTRPTVRDLRYRKHYS